MKNHSIFVVVALLIFTCGAKLEAWPMERGVREKQVTFAKTEQERPHIDEERIDNNNNNRNLSDDAAFIDRLSADESILHVSTW